MEIQSNKTNSIDKNLNDKKTKVVFILGPTGVGKTATSIKLAKCFNGEIISADSVQVYKGFDIGSAKISKEEMESITHYGIDIINPQQEFSVFDFIKYTEEKIVEINKKSKLPIIVGGTGLYVKALIENYNLGGAGKDVNLRNRLEKEIEEKGLEFVYKNLQNLYPDFANKIDGRNKIRVIRAFEIAEQGNFQLKNRGKYDYKVFALNIDRCELYNRINKRVDFMIENGLVKEVETLFSKYQFCQPMRAIGYKEVVSFLNNEISYSQMVDLIKQHSRNYAKRQLTFLKSMPYVKFIDMEDPNEAIKKIKEEIAKWLVMKKIF